MRKKFNIRAKLSVALAVVMVVTMAAPGFQAHADGPAGGSAATSITFDPQNGPGLDLSTYKKITRKDNFKGTDNHKKFEASGTQGQPLLDSGNFAGLLDSDMQDFGNGKRPKMPNYQAEIPGGGGGDGDMSWPGFTKVDWAGYTFKGWENAEGNMVTYLPYILPYDNSVTYKAVWTGNDTTEFKLTVEHYRDFREGEAGWPSDGDYADPAKIRKFYDGTWTRTANANSPVSDSYRRDIPGYQIKDVLIKNNKIRGYGDLTGEGTGRESATISDTTKALRGIMPNDDLTVAYRYEPNSAREYAVSVKCVMRTEAQESLEASVPVGREIQITPPVVVKRLPVESPLDMGPGKETAPPAIDHYVVDTSIPPVVTSGPSDLSGSGVISARDAGMKAVGSGVSGPMPNQNVTITYTYKLDSSLHSKLTIASMDDGNVSLGSPIIKDGLAIGSPVTFTIDPKPGYRHSPNVTWSKDITAVTKEVAGDGKLTLTVTPGIQEGVKNPGQVTLTYLKNLNDGGFWGKVVFYDGQYGGFGKDEAGQPVKPAPLYFKRSPGLALAEAVAGISLVAESKFYKIEGWYLTDDSGKKTGEVLDDSYQITASVGLVPSFVENASFWADLRFKAGPNGSVGVGEPSHIKKGTEWKDVAKPRPTADSGYHFISWVDEGGNEIPDDSAMAIQGDHTYTAKFAPTFNVDDGLLAMPDVRGAVAEDGRGRMVVSGANRDRKYVLTDDAGTILEVKPGVNASAFDGLKPGSVYRVYEIKKDAPLQNPPDQPGIPPGVMPGAVDPGDASQPASGAIPAIGKNYTVSEDEGGTMKVVVRPTAPDTKYAILDMAGNAAGSLGGDGWVTPSDLNGAVLGGLTPDQLYVVVAKQAGEEGTASGRLHLGTQVSVMKRPSQGQEYSFSLLNGGFISRIDYADGREALTAEDGQVTSAMVKENDKITFSAYRTEGNAVDGNPWGHWSVLIGGGKLANETQRFREMVMKPANMVMQANYPGAVSSDSGTLSFDYSPRDGITALDVSEDQLTRLKDQLLSSSDTAIMDQKGDVKYTVNFKRGVPKATQSDAARAALADSLGGGVAPRDVKAPWTLDSSLTRQVAGSNKALASGSNATAAIKIYSEVDRSMLGYGAYALWEVSPDGGISPGQVFLSPDSQGFGPMGVISFEGKVGTSYVMTYLKSYKLTVKDEGHAHLDAIYVAPGTALSETELYGDLKELEYQDPVTGENYIFDGVDLEASSARYDADSPIDRNLDLKVRYVKEDDKAWQEARTALMKQIDLANVLMSQASTGADDKARLAAAIAPAREAVGKVPRVSVSELERLRTDLMAVIDSVSGGEDPDKPVIPPTPPSPGGSTGGGGGSGGGFGISIKIQGPSKEFGGYKTYFSGVEGQWEPVGTDWSFALKNGALVKDQWINVTYGNGRDTLTYHINGNGLMDHGWFQAADGSWYYLDDTPGSSFGRLNVGWHYDAKLQKWFYLNTFKGLMTTGWQQVGEDWYYLSPASQAGRPLGSLYTGELTPDGYHVDENGRWIRQTP